MVRYEELSGKAKKDLKEICSRIIKFTDKYNIDSIKFRDVSYFDCDDYFHYVMEVEIDDEEVLYIRER